MKIVLLGKNGQVGWELQRSLSYLGEVVSLDFDSQEGCGDFTQPEKLIATLLNIKPTVIVNAAAHTAVDKAESESKLAFQINAQTVEAIAKVAQQLDCWLVHYSTDYVFDGSGDRPWSEEDMPAPLNIYGQSKLVGEQAIQRHCSKYLIFRTSWVYASRGNNFARTMLRLAQNHVHLTVINDQFGAPTSAELLADCTAHSILVALQQPQVAGLYHLVAGGETTWYNYAQYVFDFAKQNQMALQVTEVTPVDSSAYPTPAKRPHNSRLSTQKFINTFNYRLPHWQNGVQRMLHEITEK
ncbi:MULTISPECIES: dTDP-4-dehydrorhamnose reductase [Vibrio]|uniref:dTDP-4-dehydrorhamnose reductase n=1 Tax=Vibrio TaxID=662 RepID=UPI000647ECD8|nr:MULTISPECIES: dTDP-4-dehydrorhamnose reductase [Vibrio]MBY7668157.1 dTDP-4-dehydrorhamnose reductase [Vibrio anguillarum]NAX45384.1 dTDP-4-dehydrorhamnose reductase [Vibrio sp. V25_P4S6T154]OXX47703.1 NAD(P)-dependent oxidoreductase [Vibrio sp. V17_P4S1T151]OXX61408.1 NAD(P)-dependent oxidoreductase [Vibrio sp. V15_P4S5T153]OXX67042.1 NAD(P)-dependent oxidoreductase [Vibrio sp. V20_P4S3T152]